MAERHPAALRAEARHYKQMAELARQNAQDTTGALARDLRDRSRAWRDQADALERQADNLERGEAA